MDGASLTQESNRRDLAFWREILSRAPALANIPGRRRVTAPTGLGCNRGDMGFLRITLHGGAVASPNSLLAAFIATLEEAYSLDSIVIDHWNSKCGTEQVGGLLVPIGSFTPVVLTTVDMSAADRLKWVALATAQANAHRSYDTSELEHVFCDFLRSRKIALRQFGFVYIDAEQSAHLSALASPLDAIVETPHEIQLALTVSNEDLQLRLGVDLDVLGEVQAQRLFGLLLEKWRETSGLPECRLGEQTWRVRQWPKIEIVEPMKSQKGAPSQNVEREIPVTTEQLVVLREADTPGISEISLSNRMITKEFIARPSLDKRRLTRAINVLVRRHEAMRTRFFRKDEGYGAYLEREPSKILFFEQAKDEVEALRRGSEVAQHVISLMDPLFRVTVIEFGNEGDLIIAAAHHGITDGHSVGLILEELFRAYLGMDLPKIEMDIETYFREYDFQAKPESKDLRDNFLGALFANPPPIPDIGRKSVEIWAHDNVLKYGRRGSLTHLISPDQRSSLQERAKLVGATESSMVSAAFASMLAERGRVDEVILAVASSQRTSRYLKYYVNCLTTNLPVRVRPSAYGRLDDLAAAIKQGIEAASVHRTFLDAYSFGEFRDVVLAKGSYMTLFLTGEVAPGNWSSGSLSAPIQRFDATGEIDLGSMKLDLSPGIVLEHTTTKALDVRSFKTHDSLGIALAYDTLGFDYDEAEAFLADVVARLNLPG